MDNSCPQIYSQEEWHRNNYKWYCQSNAARCDWHKLRENATCEAKQRAALTKCMQDETTKELANRAKELADARSEISKFLDLITSEIHKLNAQKKRLENVLDTLQDALNVTQECLNLRRQRIGSDVVEDEVQCNLLKEEQMIKDYQCQVQKLLEQVEEQIRKNMQIKKCLEFDWSDKSEAYKIDTNAGHLTDCSTGEIAFYPGQETLPERWSTLQSWADFCKDNLEAARQEITASGNLRCCVDQFLKDMAAALRNQADAVDVALARRIAETADCLYRLSQHLDLIAKDIVQAEETINFLRQELLNKESALKKAQTRLHNRNQRPNVELCKDAAQHSLLRELRELADTVHKLEKNLEQAEAGLASLLETRRGLETEAAVKQNTLVIDKERCSAVRQRFPACHKLLGY